MGKPIYKYPLRIVGFQAVQMPKGARILSFANQNERAVMWAIVDPSAPEENRKFWIVGTGHKVPAGSLNYISTAQFIDNKFVAHLFEEVE